MTNGNVVVDKAVPAAVKSRKKVMITDSIAGVIAGLGLGVGIVVVGAVLTDRLRRRDEIAIAVGAPVELSIGRYRRPRFFRKWRLDRRVRRPSRDMRMVERRIRAHLESAPGSALAVVPVECSEPAALAMASLALSLGREGRRVIVADLADGRPLQSLLERHSATGALGDVELDAATEPRRSLLARFEDRRYGHVERRRPPRDGGTADVSFRAAPPEPGPGRLPRLPRVPGVGLRPAPERIADGATGHHAERHPGPHWIMVRLGLRTRAAAATPVLRRHGAGPVLGRGPDDQPACDPGGVECMGRHLTRPQS